MEKPTLYQWLTKIIIIGIVIIMANLFVILDKKYPNFKNSLFFKYVITPLLYVLGFILVIIFIA